MNRDGKTQTSVRNFAQLNINKLSVDYKEVQKDQQIQNHGGLEANIVKYQVLRS